MDEFKPNSHKYREEQKASEERQKTEKVVSGKVTTKKKTGVQKFADRFISEDAANIKSYISEDIIIPCIKNLIEDIFTKGIRILLRGQVDDRRDGRTPASRVSYNGCYDRDNRNSSYVRSSSRYSYEDIIFDNLHDAKEVLAKMDEIVDTYKMVCVADLYDLVGMVASTTDYKYGWIDIRSARIEPTREGYFLKLPKAIPLD
jgi:hypothetical protein